MQKTKKIIVVLCVVLASLLALGAFVGIGRFFSKSDEGSVDYAAKTYGLRTEDYFSLYVQDGLVACYMAYDGFGSVSASEEDEDLFLWQNQVPNGKPAYLYGADYWRAQSGGIGYRMSIDQYVADKNNVGLVLDYDLDIMENQDVVVECVCSYVGITDGDVRYNAPADLYKYGVYNKEKSAFRFDLLCSLSFVSNSEKGANSSMTNRWYLTNWAYADFNANATTPGWEHVGNEKVAYSSSIDDVFLFRYWRTYDESCWNTSVALDYIRFNNTLYNVDYVSDKYRNLLYFKKTDLAPSFSLFNGYPCNVYALRYYSFGENRDMTSDAMSTFTSYYDVQPLTVVSWQDVQNLTYEQIAEKYFIDVLDADDFKADVRKTSTSEDKVYLMRFAVTEYFCKDVDIVEVNSANVVQGVSAMIAQQACFLGFDILEFTFNKECPITIPVASASKDVIGSIIGPQKPVEDVKDYLEKEFNKLWEEVKKDYSYEDNKDVYFGILIAVVMLLLLAGAVYLLIASVTGTLPVWLNSVFSWMSRISRRIGGKIKYRRKRRQSERKRKRAYRSRRRYSSGKTRSRYRVTYKASNKKF